VSPYLGDPDELAPWLDDDADYIWKSQHGRKWVYYYSMAEISTAHMGNIVKYLEEAYDGIDWSWGEGAYADWVESNLKQFRRALEERGHKWPEGVPLPLWPLWDPEHE